MERSSDIRVERTRALLLEALVRLMRDRDAAQVSVAQLTRTAQVNRSTFYAHYVDIFDFLDTETQRLVDGLIETVGPNDSNPHEDGPQYLRFFEYVRDNAPLFQAMLGPHGYYRFREYMEERGRITYERLIGPGGLKGMGAITADSLAMYIVTAHMGIIMWWLDDGLVYTADSLARLLDRLTVKGVLASVGMAEEEWIPS